MAVATGKQSTDRFSDPHGYSYCPFSGGSCSTSIGASMTRKGLPETS
jgi:hypothetical protein